MPQQVLLFVPSSMDHKAVFFRMKSKLAANLKFDMWIQQESEKIKKGYA